MLTIRSQAGKNLLLFLTAVTVLTACRPPGARALFDGQKLLEKGNYALAVQQFRTATVLLGSTNAQAFACLGLACHYAGQAQEAERAYLRALALNPDLAEVRFNLGCLWLSENRVDQAKTELTAYTLRRGNSLDGWLKLASAQLRSREPAAAERSFGQALRLAPQNPEALNGMGLVRLARNRSGVEAAGFFAQALKAQPDYGPALLNLAIVAQEHLRDRPLALRTYREYLGLKPPREHAQAVRAIVRQLEQESAPPPHPAPVLKAVTPAASNAPKPSANEPAHASLPPKVALTESPHQNITPKVESGSISRAPATELREKRTGSAALPASLAEEKSQPALLSNSSAKHEVGENPPRPANTVSSTATPPSELKFDLVQVPAEPVVKPAENLSTPPTAPAPEVAAGAPDPPGTNDPKSPKSNFFQKLNPLALFRSENKPSAHTPMPAASEAITPPQTQVSGSSSNSLNSGPARYAYHPPEALPMGNRAEAEVAFSQGAQAQKAQRLAEAIQAYRRAIEADPSFFDAHYNLGLAAFDQGNLPLALSAYENALTLRPESENARYNFALALKQASYPLDAAAELERVLASYPNDGRAQLALGNLYAQQLHQPAKARPHYLKLLEIDPRNAQASAVRYWLTANPK